jgi:hypothetical protein
MTAKETTSWMKEKGCWKRWLLPLHDLNTEADLCAFKGWPIGNSPEMMPSICSLNSDVKTAVDSHLLFTCDFDDDDERNFSMSTPLRGSSAWHRLLHPETGGVPSSKRIVQDVLKVVVDSINEIRRQDGIAIDGLGDQRGKRHTDFTHIDGPPKKKTVVDVSVMKSGSLPSWRHCGFIQTLKMWE